MVTNGMVISALLAGNPAVWIALLIPVICCAVMILIERRDGLPAAITLALIMVIIGIAQTMTIGNFLGFYSL